MPNCFTLTRKREEEPSTFVEIDNELCKMLGVEPDPEFFVNDWYDNFGLIITMGTQLGTSEFRKYLSRFPEGRLKKIGWYLEKNFKSNAWYQQKITTYCYI